MTYIPDSFDGYDSAVHPPYDSVANLDARYRLIQQRQLEPIWDVSIPGQFLGRIKWVKSGWRIVNINRTTIKRSQPFQCWQDAVMALGSLAICKAVAA